MSKAFTREVDDLPEEPVVARWRSALPPGATNWMTADGAQRLTDEVTGLHERRAADAGTDLWQRALEQRLVDLEHLLDTAEVITRHGGAADQVRFGATVRVRANEGGERRYRIVGVDETDLDRGWVSWVSPLARTLLGARRGQRVTFRFPSGETELEIMDIADTPDS